MTLANEIIAAVERELTLVNKKAVIIQHAESIVGGDINQTFKLLSSDGNYFLKLNSEISAEDFFIAEADGLIALYGKSSLVVPKPVLNGVYKNHRFLLTDFLSRGRPSKNFWKEFGTGLAELHTNTHLQFGWFKSNYIGTLVQHNSWCQTWTEFHAVARVLPLVKIAHDRKIINSHDLAGFERLCTKLTGLIPEEKPALLHGDLWSGNFLVNSEGVAAVFDPSVYFGHREMDLAMTKLFGGFQPEFYRFYNDRYPLQPGWEERVPLFQLYPLLVHLLLFGGHYYESVLSVSRKFG